MSICSAVGVRGVVLDVRPAAVRVLDAAGVPLPPRLLARPHLPRLLHRRRPLRVLRRQEQPPLRAASHQVSIAKMTQMSHLHMWPKMWAPGLVNFVPAFAYHF